MSQNYFDHPFKCCECERAFRHKIYLHYHKLLHVGLTPEKKETDILIFPKAKEKRALTNCAKSNAELFLSNNHDKEEILLNVAERNKSFKKCKFKYRGQEFMLTSHDFHKQSNFFQQKISNNSSNSRKVSNCNGWTPRSEDLYLCEKCGVNGFYNEHTCNIYGSIENGEFIPSLKPSSDGGNASIKRHFVTRRGVKRSVHCNLGTICMNTVSGQQTLPSSNDRGAHTVPFNQGETKPQIAEHADPFLSSNKNLSQIYSNPSKHPQANIEMELPTAYLQTYLCEYCGNEFRRKIDLERHIRIHTGERPFQCATCKRCFIQKAHLKIHAKRHSHVDTRQELILSPFLDENSNKINESDKQYNPQHVCKICQKQFSQKGHLNVHMLIHTGARPFHCDICKRNFNQKQTLKRHMVTHLEKNREGMSRFKTQIRTPMENRENLENAHSYDSINSQHIYQSNQVKTKNNPDECLNGHIPHRFSNSFPKSKKLSNGERIATANYMTENPRSENKCKFCGKQFKQKGHLNVHLLIHTGIKPFKCDICGKKFNQKQILKRHLLIHRPNHLEERQKTSQNILPGSNTGEFICEFCGKNFNNKYNFQKHRLIHSGQKPFLCGECGKSFRQKNHLVDHQRIHSGDRPFICDICSKMFSQKQNLKKHLQRHAKQTGYSDKIEQNKVVKGNTNLNIRLKGDSGIRGNKNDEKERVFSCNILDSLIKKSIHTFQCDHCGKEFKRKEYLKVHLRTHTGEKPYTCQLCSMNFAQRGHLWVHMSRHK